MTRIAAALVLVALASPVVGQDTRARDMTPAWLGVVYDLQWIQTGSTCASQVMVGGVIPGSPAERAGLRAGDVVVAIDGDTAPGRRLQAVSVGLVPGDSIRLAIRRGGSVREVTAVADRRPARVPNLPQPAAAPDRGRGAPLIQVRGDTLVATNLDAVAAAVGRRAPGYWLSAADGRTSFRTLAARPASELDRRVGNLLACANTQARIVSLGAHAEQVQERAESLRVAIAHRALARREGETARVMVQQWTPAALAAAGGSEVMIFRAEEALAASLRGVAGAEVVAMEPELAAYFRGVDAGLLVVRVASGSAADRSGLRPGDVIVDIGGRAVTASAELRAGVAAPGAGPVQLSVVRQGRKRVVSLPRP
jgi:predicted metalloprotease with PDZ domain